MRGALRSQVSDLKSQRGVVAQLRGQRDVAPTFRSAVESRELKVEKFKGPRAIAAFLVSAILAVALEGVIVSKESLARLVDIAGSQRRGGSPENMEGPEGTRLLQVSQGMPRFPQEGFLLYSAPEIRRPVPAVPAGIFPSDGQH